MNDCPYTIKKEWKVSDQKHILRVSAIDANGSVVDSIERNISPEKIDLPEHFRQHGNNLKEDIEKAFEEELIIRLKQFGKI